MHNTFPLISPSVLYACRDAGVPVVVTLHNYKLACASGDFFRDGGPCHDCAGGYGGARTAARLLPGFTDGDRPVARAGPAPVGVAGAGVRLHLHLGLPARPDADLHLPEERVFVKHNFVRSVSAARTGPEHLVVYLGRLDAAKGVPFLMLAGTSSGPVHPDSPLRLAVAGGGPLEDDVRAWGSRHPSVDVMAAPAPRRGRAPVAPGAVTVVPSHGRRPSGSWRSRRWRPGWHPSRRRAGPSPSSSPTGSTGPCSSRTIPARWPGSCTTSTVSPGGTPRLGARGRRTYEERFRPGANLAQLVDVYRFATSHPIGGHRVVVP